MWCMRRGFSVSLRSRYLTQRTVSDVRLRMIPDPLPQLSVSVACRSLPLTSRSISTAAQCVAVTAEKPAAHTASSFLPLCVTLASSARSLPRKSGM